jgi:hypothetical protein
LKARSSLGGNTLNGIFNTIRFKADRADHLVIEIDDEDFVSLLAGYGERLMGRRRCGSWSWSPAGDHELISRRNRQAAFKAPVG